jgi:hypothetical protein
MVGLGLTAKYGLKGLTKIGFANNQGPGQQRWFFITCYAIGKVLAFYFKVQGNGSVLFADEAKEMFKAAKAEAERLAAT